MARAWLAIAMTVGLVHSGFSVYWGLGGGWLLATVGQQMVSTLGDMRSVLIIVGLVKAICAIAPYVLFRRGKLSHRSWLIISWAGAAALMVWGGAGCVTAHLVLGGVVRPDGGYDKAGQIGHAWLWDPLFLIWSLALMAGLMTHRREMGRRQAARAGSDCGTAVPPAS